MPSELELYIGAPVMLTTNIAVELLLSNGAFGTVTKIAFDNDDVERSKNMGQRTAVPKYVIVRFDQTVCQQLPGLQKGEVPVFPVAVSYRFKFPGMIRPATVRRWQVPLVDRFSYTSYKSQSKTLDAAIVDLNLPRNADASFAYVPLSRVRKLDDIVILRPFPISILKSGLSKDLIAQNKRFEEMERNQ